VARFTERREREADAAAAALAGAPALASGLAKLYAYGRYWRRALAALREPVRRGERNLSLAAVFTDTARREALAKLATRGIPTEAFEHPSDAHPPLDERLEAIGQSLPDATQLVVAHASAPAARERLAAWVPDHEQIERALTERERTRMIEAHEVWVSPAAA
jgi:hypothetical protein